MPSILSLDRLQEEFGAVADNKDNPESTNHQQKQHLQKALLRVIQEELSPCQRQVILLYFFDGENIPAIAKQLGVNKSTVSRTLKRARENLKKYLRYINMR